MAEKTGKKINKPFIIVLICAVLVVGALAVFLILALNGGGESTVPSPSDNLSSNGEIQYQEGVVVLDAESLQKAYDDLVKKTEEGYIDLEYQREMFSADGKEFTCYLNNPVENTYDCYFDMYTDSTFTDENRIMLTGLIPPGSGIDHFTSEMALPRGRTTAILVITQVEDDHSTMHAQVKVEVELVVNDE